MDSLSRRVVVLFVITLFAMSLFAAQPRFVTIDVSGADQTIVLGINAAGDMVGSYIVAGVEHGFILRNGVVETVDYPGAAWTECWGINPRGDVVGQYFVAANRTTHGFLLPAGTSEALPIEIEQPTDLGPANTMPFKINAEGTITGCIHQSNANGGAFVYSMHGFVIDGSGVSIDPLAGSMHEASSPSGVIVGNYYTSNTTMNSFIMESGAMTWLNMTGFKLVRAFDINATGDVVGVYRLTFTSGPFHAFLYHDGEFTTIDVPFSGATGTRAFGINPQGDVVGNYYIGSISHGFLLTKRGN